jgi:hypothetical protein
MASQKLKLNIEKVVRATRCHESGSDSQTYSERFKTLDGIKTHFLYVVDVFPQSPSSGCQDIPSIRPLEKSKSLMFGRMKSAI